MSHSSKTYAFSLDADRFIREDVVTTATANTVAGTTVTVNSITTLSVGQSVWFLKPDQTRQDGPVTITAINPSTKVLTVNAAVTVNIGDTLNKQFQASAQMVLGVQLANLNPEAALVTLTSIDGTITHGYYLSPANGPFLNNLEWMAYGGIKIAAVVGVTTPSDVKITIFAKNQG